MKILYNRELTQTLEEALEYLDAIHSFYGQGLQVYGWHLNGDPEPFDSFIDDNYGIEVEDNVRKTLEKSNEERQNE